MADNDHDLPTIKTDGTTERLEASEPTTLSVEGFRLKQKLGEGGMGEVWEAEQLEPVRRRVALKLIKRGMESKAVLARFDSERQALALMSHPNIAQVFDAGTTADGRPYFVMEYVPGVPLTRYCDDHRLSTRERLELFVQICEGVQHAHHKGVIHRDLKPSNVLVMVQEQKAVPKIIDFGIAKATTQRLTEDSLFTAMGEFIGTPEYMSPEQADLTSLDIDTRTDVYSLGVMLYEMLAGAKPFEAAELRQAGFDGMRRMIREDEPPRPSARLSDLGEQTATTAAARRTEPSTLVRQLRGDLDWITMQALEKDRTRRYDSPGELASDIGRHLRDEPVVAGPPSASYRIGKFVRRHTMGVAAGAVVAAALVLGIVGTTIGMVRARDAEREAAREAETARQVSDFLIGLFEVSDPSQAKGETITAREILDQGAARVESELVDEPLVGARMMYTMGDVYRKLGLYDQALPLLEQSLEIRRSILGDRHDEVAASLHGLGTLQSDMGDNDEALRLYEQALEITEQIYGPDHPKVATTLNNLGTLFERMGEFDRSAECTERALKIRERELGEEDPLTIGTIENLGALAAARGDHETARRLFERNLDLKRRILDPNDPSLAISLNNLAVLLSNIGDLEAARPLLAESLEIRERVLGPDHPLVASTIANLAMIDHQTGSFESAAELYERALVKMEASLGPDHRNLSFPMANLAELLRDQGEYERARPLHERAMVLRREGFGEEHPLVANSLHNLGLVDKDTGNVDEALRKITRAVEILETALPPNHPWLGAAVRDLAMVQLSMGDVDEAIRGMERAVEILPEDPIVWYNVACLKARTGDPEAAFDGLERAVELGFADLEQIESDPDLESLRQDERFVGIVSGASENRAAG